MWNAYETVKGGELAFWDSESASGMIDLYKEDAPHLRAKRGREAAATSRWDSSNDIIFFGAAICIASSLEGVERVMFDAADDFSMAGVFADDAEIAWLDLSLEQELALQEATASLALEEIHDDLFAFA